ncbi:S-methyl-5-thioribose kinase [Paenibacillus sp. HJL G12]|uniref:S-methyl-5-thioribose kinase n=1 Tax=Paenibacillus dendrobii TaxID=2691084 RepID=A0A7X3LHH2_9BACL|nr:S-methyl-5-thioribose kinase [Paenibacillus dendrobii]MWV43234.1 S-methyl-5-thioribose kinase [Paenibacillus dendrobii]
MHQYTEYFTMNESDVLNYALTQLDVFDRDAKLTCKEIGDGNLNYVFLVVDPASGKSLIIKQAGPVARISADIEVSTDRNRIESEILKIQYELAPGLVPKFYKYDPVMNCCVMEDLSDHDIMRKALLEHRQFPLFADHITTFMVNTLLLTSDVVMNHKEKKDLVKSFINPDLCEISEDLVYTEPFYDCPRNDIFEPTRNFAKSYLWEDEALLLETAKLKFEFMSHAQSLLHGDLHSGSIFIKDDSTKIIDPEFAFYGPAGYDIGNVIAHLLFAYVNADSVMEDTSKREEQKAWLLSSVRDAIDMFREKFLNLFREKATDRSAQIPGFDMYYLNEIIQDTAAVTGLELCRRTLGLAHVKDITCIEDAVVRAHAEKFCLIMGKKFIMERSGMVTGEDFVRVVTECIGAKEVHI